MKVELNKDNFEQEVLYSKIPVIVDFNADWCEPCKMLSVILDEISEEYAGKIKVCSVNVDDQRELAKAYRIQNIPKVIYFKDGYAVTGGVGYAPKEQVLEMIAEDIQ